MRTASPVRRVLGSPDEGAAAPPNTYVTTDGGVRWRLLRVPVPPKDYASVFKITLGCSTTTCYLIDFANPSRVLSSINAASTSWSPVPSPSSPDPVASIADVACGGGRCVAVGADTSQAGILLESDAGGAWTETLAPTRLGNPIQNVFSVACSAYACGTFGDDNSSIDGALL